MQRTLDLTGKRALITGAGSGIGRAIALRLAEEGMKLALVGRSADKLMRTAAMTGRPLDMLVLPTDITTPKGIDDIMRILEGHFKGLDVLVNNAGINIRKPVEEMSIDEWCTMMKVNTGSAFLGCKYAIPVMRRQGGGAIINTSSVCGLVGHKYTPEAYTASKGAVTMLTKAIASRYAGDGIRCNSIHPSTVDTPLVRERLKDPKFHAERLGEVPLGRLATADDVANAVLYLASEEASFINGVALPIDGGVTCY